MSEEESPPPEDPHPPPSPKNESLASEDEPSSELAPLSELSEEEEEEPLSVTRYPPEKGTLYVSPVMKAKPERPSTVSLDRMQVPGFTKSNAASSVALQ